MKLRSIALNLTALALAAGLAACSDNTTEIATTLSGEGVKGPVYKAQVTAEYKLSANEAREQHACGQNDATVYTGVKGEYNCVIPKGAVGPFKVVLTGGMYCSSEDQVLPAEPATLSTPALLDRCANGTLVNNNVPLSTVVVQSGNQLAVAPITPFTTMAVEAAEASTGGLDNFVKSYVAVATVLKIDVNPTANPLDSAANSNAKKLLQAVATQAQSVTTTQASITSALPASFDYADLKTAVAAIVTTAADVAAVTTAVNSDTTLSTASTAVVSNANLSNTADTTTGNVSQLSTNINTNTITTGAVTGAGAN
jgi:hypothetical protein